ncbi:hypothetical protein [Pseudoalteromonas gelatinilytica]|uniref:Uncharacterized protein n=1 Tax=Pseudoalteromonas gelatinilytica TaxID=1703256 RepID=A0A3A3EGU2_9GAMM|nr:hypothetical protein [Pseudoalteromonas profundi]RJF34356.1 hypothetical protein D4741_13275 [Pseudoalteromonas profundi]
MARRTRRRNKQGGNGSILIIKAFVTLFVLLVMIGSFLLFAAWWFFERKAANTKQPDSIHDFDHTNEEISAINQQSSRLDRVYSRLDQIEVEGRSLTRRQDGMFNERSKKGKQFNQEINSLSPEADRLEQSLADLEALPVKRLNEWAFYASMHLSLRKASLGYVLSFIIFAWLQPKWVLELSNTMQNLSLLDFYAAYPIAYGASVGALFISAIVLGVSFFLTKEKKIQELANSEHKEVVEEQRSFENEQREDNTVSVESFVNSLSELPHTTLKEIVDEFGINADRRSKATIIDAIRSAEFEVIQNIYLKLN